MGPRLPGVDDRNLGLPAGEAPHGGEAVTDAPDDRVDRLLAIVYGLNERMAAIETHLAIEAPAVPDGLTPIKRAAGEAGYSESYVRKLIADGRVEAVKLGGRVFIARRA